MSETERCPNCGGRLSQQALSAGLCPKCLLQQVLDTTPTEPSPPEAADPRSGTTISHFQVGEKLGEGGMGIVYAGTDMGLCRRVALKFLKPRLTADPRAHSRFLLEARAASALDHPNIGTIYEVGEERDQPFIAMALYKGKALSELLDSGPLEIDEVITVLSQVAAGLEAAHTAGIVHRDIKPSNLMLTDDGQVKIVDFGLARLTETEDRTGVKSDPETVLGTLAYMSPEQARGNSVDERTDLWSLGVVAYELLTGETPFKAPSAIATLSHLLGDEPVRPAAIREEIPEALDSLVISLLAKDSGERVPSASEALAALRRLQGDTPGRRRKKKHWVPLAGTLAIVLAILSVFINRTEIESLVVLPLDNLGHDPAQGIFVDGVTEGITRELSRFEKIRVISFWDAMRYKDSDLNLTEIANRLEVDGVVAGSVIRRGDRVSVSAQLVEAGTEVELWGQTFQDDVSDILALQQELAGKIAEHTRAGDPKEFLPTNPDPIDPDALEAYMKGLYALNKRTHQGLVQALAYFDEAIESEPTYAQAHAALADTYNLLGSVLYGVRPPVEVMPRARAAAQTALELDDLLADAHNSLAFYRLFYEWDLPGAEVAFKRAIDLSPSYAMAHHWYGVYLMLTGQIEASMEEARRALLLAPLSPIINADMGSRFLYQGDYERAIEILRGVLTLDPAFGMGHFFLGRAYHIAGLNSVTEILLFEQAISEYEKALELEAPLPVTLAHLGHAYAVSNRQEAAREVLARLTELSNQRYIPAHAFATVHLGLGEMDEVFHWLDKAYSERSGVMIYLSQDPLAAALRPDPRYQRLMDRMKQPQALE